MSRRVKGESSTRRAGVAAACGALVTAAFLFLVAPVVGDGLNSSPAPAPNVVAATHPATSAQISGVKGIATVSARKKKSSRKSNSKPVLRRIAIHSRITDEEILTEEGKGTFIGIKCPAGSKAISGGVLSKYINLLVSSSAPNHPLTRKYTPNTWWLTVTNVNVDGNGGTLPWRGVVNCLSPVRLGSRTG